MQYYITFNEQKPTKCLFQELDTDEKRMHISVQFRLMFWDTQDYSVMENRHKNLQTHQMKPKCPYIDQSLTFIKCLPLRPSCILNVYP